MFALAQVMLTEGPTTYSLGDLRDATKLAQKIVQSYGMTDLGITMHAPKQHAIGFMKRAFEVRLSCDKKDTESRHALLLQCPVPVKDCYGDLNSPRAF